ncbi:hypothetical protein DKT68_25630, partial [Micromonospora acroterricola]
PADAPPPAVAPGPATPALTTDAGPESAVRRRLLAADAEPSTLDPVDRAYAAGDAAGALDGYRRRLSDDPDDADAWVGLALAARRAGRPAAALALATRPDLVRAAHQALPDADVLTLAAWCQDTTAPPEPGAVSRDGGPGTARG